MPLPTGQLTGRIHKINPYSDGGVLQVDMPDEKQPVLLKFMGGQLDYAGSHKDQLLGLRVKFTFDGREVSNLSRA